MRADALTVLVVEDDPDLVLIMRHELTIAGHKVLVATSPDHAVAQAADADIVLLDFHLPGSDGLEVLRRIQELYEPPSVVMVTGDDLGGLDEEAMRAGAIDFVPKRPGYLRALPGIVQRAARAHDLGRRVGDIEAVALSLLSADSRDEAVAEILHGACRMLRANRAALVEVVGTEVHSHAQVGGAQGLIDLVMAMPSQELPAPGRALAFGEDAVVVRLVDHASDRHLLLLAGAIAGAAQSRDELALAEAYARLAATALQAARRRRREAEVLDALHAATATGRERIERVRLAVGQNLARAHDELGRAIGSTDVEPDMLRSLARAEAGVAAALHALEDLAVAADSEARPVEG